MTEKSSSPKARRALVLLTAAYVLNFVDRQLVGILGQPMKAELGLSDTQLGLLGGLAFALLYSIAAIPVARLAERRSRVTIVAVSLATWSAMTALCGLARGFPALVAARVGVGIGEAGCAAPAQSLVADIFPPERRATALGLFSLGVPIGMFVAAIGGGWIADALGWRAAFIALGLPGVVLAAVLARFPEPPRAGEAPAPPPLIEVGARLLADRAFRHMACGATLASFAGYGVTTFAVPLLVRDFGLPLRAAATGFGIVAALAIGVGIAGGGWLTDRAGRSRSIASARIAGVGTVAAAALFELTLAQQDMLYLGLSALPAVLAAHLYFAPTYALTIAVVDVRSRATAIALLLLAVNGIGLGLGPLAVGLLSDRLGLSAALRIHVLAYAWAAVHFAFAARALHEAHPQSAER